MDPMLIAQLIFSALVGGSITGVISWIKFSNALAILRVEVDHMREYNDEARADLKLEKTERNRQHRENGEKLEERLSKIQDRLVSIETYICRTE